LTKLIIDKGNDQQKEEIYKIYLTQDSKTGVVRVHIQNMESGSTDIIASIHPIDKNIFTFEAFGFKR